MLFTLFLLLCAANSFKKITIFFSFGQFLCDFEFLLVSL
jgi:hypothetical protein